MMHPTNEEVQEIYQLWKDEFAFDDGGFTDDFFKRNFSIETCYVHRVQGVIAATLCAFPHCMKLQEKQVSTIFICGVITKERFRHRGYMNLLFQTVFEVHKECALFLLQAYHPEIYTSLNFEMYYFYNVYESSQSSSRSYTISQIMQPQDMKQLFDIFMSTYDGYLIRDVAYYENYIKEAAAQDILLYGIYEQNHLQGYARLDIHEACLEEVLYTNEDVRKALVSHALTKCDRVKIYSFIPLEESYITSESALMIRLHSLKQLKNIFQRDIQSLEDIFNNSTKQLYHYGSW